MFKKVELWFVLILILVITISFGILVRQELEGKKKLGYISKLALEISRTPARIKWLLNTENTDPQITKSNSKKNLNFEKNLEFFNDALYLLSRYDAIKETSVIELRKIDNFELLHTFYVDQEAIYKKLKDSKKLNTNYENVFGKRFQINHPIIFHDGSIIAKAGGSLFKMSLCNKFSWINDEIFVHHSNTLDRHGNIWSPTFQQPYSLDKKFLKDSQDFIEDGITKFSPDGKIAFNKSLSKIIIENGFQGIIFGIDRKLFNDPTHLNDIEVAFKDTDYWKKDDIFLSLRNRSLIIHYRPSNNKIINVIFGPFGHQHDVDFFSDKEISIFNNNNFSNTKGESNTKNNELLIFNFETNTFYNKYSKAFKNNNINTPTGGLSDRLTDGSLIVEEQDYGRIIYLKNDEQKIWEFNNVNKGKNYMIGWGRVVEDPNLVNNVLISLQNLKCSNK